MRISNLYNIMIKRASHLPPCFATKLLQKRYKYINKLIINKYCTYITKNMDLNIKTFVFLDSETTGLPLYENNRTRITEICLTAVQSDHIELGVFPRVQNILNLCFNPGKYIDPESTNITKLSNELLEFQPPFNIKTFQILQDFLNLQIKPVCLVAHNGDQFDYPILRAELQRTKNDLPQDILCIDSLKAFRKFHEENISNQPSNEQSSVSKINEVPPEFKDGYDQLLSDVLSDLLETTNVSTSEAESNIPTVSSTVREIQRRNETTPKKNSRNNNVTQMGKHKAPLNTRTYATGSVKRGLFVDQRTSFKLGNLYTNLTGKQPIDAHNAEIDVKMLIECAAIMGERFTQWANQNAKPFCDIPPMTPGKKIGIQ